MKQVLLAGEGRNDLGGWGSEPQWRNDPAPGPIEALLRRIAPEGWTIRDAIRWKDIRKLKSRGHGRAETLNVRAVVLHARELGCDVLVFVRDVDNDSSREAEIESAIVDARRDLEFEGIVGGVAIRKLEAWLLALRGDRGTEAIRDPKSVLRALGFETTEQYSRIVAEAALDALPRDAQSLHRWLGRARAGFGAGVSA